jgi:riboflavin synthase
MDPFAALGAPRRYDLDLTVLEKTHRELSRALHPDKFTQTGASERRAALEKAANVNEAWRILRDPIRRAEALFRLEGLAVGESVAVDGACLTVTAIEGGAFRAFASAETLSRTGLGSARTGSRVNLERAVHAGEPLGGHLVSGHVDCRVALLERAPSGAALHLVLALPAGPERLHVAPKGSVCLDGVSLTVNGVLRDRFDVMIIPHTLAATTLEDARVGDLVNLETDVLAKYVARRLEDGPAQAGGISAETLARNGFMR